MWHWCAPLRVNVCHHIIGHDIFLTVLAEIWSHLKHKHHLFLHLQICSSAHLFFELTFFPLPYMCDFMFPACNLADIQMSLAEFRLDKSNICDHPNITLCSKNTCRSGSRDSTHAPTCGPGWSRSTVTPAVTACFSLSRPSVTTCTHILTSTPPLFSCLSITTITLL